jgi:hypothetical protein
LELLERLRAKKEDLADSEQNTEASRECLSDGPAVGESSLYARESDDSTYAPQVSAQGEISESEDEYMPGDRPFPTQVD